MRTILEWTQDIGSNAGNWIDAAQDRDFWRVLVHAALNLRVPYTMEFVNIILSNILTVIIKNVILR